MEEHVNEKESVLGQILIGSISLVILLLLIVGVIIGIAYLLNP